MLSFFNSNKGRVFAKNGIVDPSKNKFTIPFLKKEFSINNFAILASPHSEISLSETVSLHYSLYNNVESSLLSATRRTVINLFKLSLANPVKASNARSPFSFSESKFSKISFF